MELLDRVLRSLEAPQPAGPTVVALPSGLRYSQYGAPHGDRLAVYFHGAPGSPHECELFDEFARNNGITFVCFDRFAFNAGASVEELYVQLADAVTQLAKGKKVDVVGFSIGAFVALQVSIHLRSRVNSLHLVSAAAPLQAGDFLDLMAGAPVFRLAMKSPLLLKVVSFFQSTLALIFPSGLFHLLFSSAAGADEDLVAQSWFQQFARRCLQSCYVGRVRGYVRDVVAYVQPWETSVPRVMAMTYVWHGARDNWTPPSMARYFEGSLARCAQVRVTPALSHYSCLVDAAPRICAMLNYSASGMVRFTPVYFSPPAPWSTGEGPHSFPTFIDL